MRLFLLLACGSILVLFSCMQDAKQAQNTQQNQQNIDKTADFMALATEYCNCSSALIALNKKAKYLASRPDLIKNPEEMSDLLMESEALQQKQVDCQLQLEEKYHTKIQENQDVLRAIKQSCPDLAELMESAKKNED
ncbi:MAG: hypothetical protein ACOYOA_15940 [Saprospiraceae bacterium]